MSIAEKLTTIAENTSKVYDKGYEDGKNSVVDLERLCESISFESLNVFGKSEVVLNLKKTTSLRDLVSIPANDATMQNTTVEHITINCEMPITDIYRMFYCYYNNDNTLKQITLNADISQCDAFNNIFVGCIALETIDGTPLDFTNCATFTQCFRGCSALVNVRVAVNSISKNFSINSSPNLSTDTIQSIINGLADLTDTDTQTLTLHADVGAKLTDEQKATITAKNWTLAY